MHHNSELDTPLGFYSIAFNLSRAPEGVEDQIKGLPLRELTAKYRGLNGTAQKTFERDYVEAWRGKAESALRRNDVVTLLKLIKDISNQKHVQRKTASSELLKLKEAGSDVALEILKFLSQGIIQGSDISLERRKRYGEKVQAPKIEEAYEAITGPLKLEEFPFYYTSLAEVDDFLTSVSEEILLNDKKLSDALKNFYHAKIDVQKLLPDNSLITIQELPEIDRGLYFFAMEHLSPHGVIQLIGESQLTEDHEATIREIEVLLASLWPTVVNTPDLSLPIIRKQEPQVLQFAEYSQPIDQYQIDEVPALEAVGD